MSVLKHVRGDSDVSEPQFNSIKIPMNTRNDLMKIQEGSNEFKGSTFKKSEKDSTLLSPYVNL